MPDYSLARHARASALAADHVEAALRAAGWPAGDVPRVAVAVGEAVANAVEHGGGPASAPVWVRVTADSGSCTVRVDDGGPGPDADALASASLPAETAVGGRGLYILTALADEVRVEPPGALALAFVAKP